MIGAQYLDFARLEILWAHLHTAARDEIRAELSADRTAESPQDYGEVQRWLSHKHAGWNLVGRVCFHLAENKSNERIVQVTQDLVMLKYWRQFCCLIKSCLHQRFEKQYHMD